MAIVINPDGTVSTVEVNYNQDGSIHSERVSAETNSDGYVSKTSFLPSCGSHKNEIYNPSKRMGLMWSKSPKRKKTFNQQPAKKKLEVQVATDGGQGQPSVVSKKSKKKTIKKGKNKIKSHNRNVKDTESYIIHAIPVQKVPTLFSFKDVDDFIHKHVFTGISQTLIVSVSENIVSDGVRRYFVNECEKHNNTVNTKYTSSDVARLQSSSRSSVTGAKPKGRRPKYGYARDKFGRIQERDHYVEGRNVNPYHDNSDYDGNDDHDSAYNMIID